MKIQNKIHRVVTGHTREGTAIFTSDLELETKIIPTGDAAMSLIWSTENVPANLNDEADGSFKQAGTTLHGGSVIRVVDMLPGNSSPFHRTSSIDYGIVLSGQVELELDNNETRILKAGDIIIQRGTIHLWRNLSQDEICRIVFVLIEAKPYEVNGKSLEEFMEH
ncbi:cupin domain-containing protein [Confluentibacter flavum]|uniref:Cupin domain-containing protein n=1 Tax=Confluentibacter flavum TaxID=1909700 RepID=A0A2N3HHV7_9FLAO|nr:cupin domain-containing protein [Confluentibacter flavum]PKQ44557.1 cupin domain-containing protein [Confluentibacter flavum]